MHGASHSRELLALYTALSQIQAVPLEANATIDILRDLAIVMMVAGGVVLLFQVLKQPVILGYIIAGLIIGPFTPPFPLVKEIGVINTLADLGIILLMFSLGLEFSLRKLRRVGKVAILGGALQVLIVFALSYNLGLILGWGTMNAIFLGAALSISSTAVIIRVLEDQHRLGNESSHVVIGILVFQDFAAIGMIAVLAGVGTGEPTNAWVLAELALKLAFFAAVTGLLGFRLVPKVMNYVAATGKLELAVVIALALCFGMALFSRSLGLSVAAGAFIAGALVSEARWSDFFARSIVPIRDMFAALFFVAVGMLLDPRVLFDYWPYIVGLTAFLIALKILAGSIAVFTMGYHHHVAIQAGIVLAPIGEFSLVLAKVGQDSGTIAPFLYPVIVGVTALSIFPTPYLIRRSEGAGAWFDEHMPRLVARYLRSTEGTLRRVQLLAMATSTYGESLRHALRGIVANLIIFTAVVALGRIAYELRDLLAAITGASATIVRAVIGLAIIVMSAVPLAAMAYYVRSLARTGTEALAADHDSGQLFSGVVAVTIVRNTATIALLAVIVTIIGLALPKIPQFPYFPLVFFGFAAIAGMYMGWDSVRVFRRRLQQLRIERMAEHQSALPAPAESERS